MIKVSIAKTYFLKENGELDLDNSLNLAGKFAGVCYDSYGYEHLKDEPVEKTNRRIDLTKNNGHHSVYDHIGISLNIEGAPKILAMVLNNEKEYTTSEKSARYTRVVKGEDSPITDKEVELYEKWIEILKGKIAEYVKRINAPESYNESKINKLAQENARYFVTVFMPTTFIYTSSLRQLNYIASWFIKYINEHNKNNEFENKLSKYMQEFVDELKKLNILDEGLLKNEKDRSISLFSEGISKKKKTFTDVYSTNYKGSFAEYAQAQRHRTINYSLELMDKKEYFVPPVIMDDEKLVDEWLKDMASVSSVYPQGELVYIYERGIFENFILKCKERLCSAAQWEIMDQTKKTLEEYYESLKENNDPLCKELESYRKGARCTFCDFECSQKCNFKEGITLTRKI